MAPSVHVLTTGGTIASTHDDGGASPTERGEELVAAVPGLGNRADLTVEELCRRGSAALDRGILAELGESARAAAADGADGVVVTHGTDTMEESAYFLDLALDVDAPVVFTGAQRGFDEPSSDGTANLLAAVRAAGHPRFVGAGGVYVAFNDEVHAARNATKAHASKLETFRSPEAGPVAVLDGNGFRFHRAPGSRSADLPTLRPGATVRMAKNAIEADGAAVERAVEDGADGIVVEATGVGNVAPALAEAIRDAIDEGIAVVLTSRCFAGAVAPKYDYPGGSKTLHDYGAIMGGDLPAHKARIKLWLALECLADVEAVREAFEG